MSCQRFRAERSKGLCLDMEFVILEARINKSDYGSQTPQMNSYAPGLCIS